jgi:hypothetical protein
VFSLGSLTSTKAPLSSSIFTASSSEAHSWTELPAVFEREEHHPIKAGRQIGVVHEIEPTVNILLALKQDRRSTDGRSAGNDRLNLINARVTIEGASLSGFHVDGDESTLSPVKISRQRPFLPLENMEVKNAGLDRGTSAFCGCSSHCGTDHHYGNLFP